MLILASANVDDDGSNRTIVRTLWFKVHKDSSVLGESGLQRKTPSQQT